jgi:hypothetical protein
VRPVLAGGHLLFVVLGIKICIGGLLCLCGRVRFSFRRPGLPVPVVPRVVVIRAPFMVLLLRRGLLLMRLFSHRYQLSYSPVTKNTLL